ncbi:macrolide family glycosyltransferase [Paenibacillus sp. CAA11]|uniref:macrolide family glycosyltransferase n=1 Tax=Paenibacillus sp. CAA11 TaxID=1532905 RepID=UPI00131F0145|nr:macrolide family glycosyltransferase [Paenibacillus sp. CAA11]
MSKLFFLGLPAHGHINPTLGLVRELTELGEQVIYYSFDAFRSGIEAAGAEFRRYPLNPANFDANQITQDFAILYRTLIEAASKLLPGLLEEIQREKPDYIIHDSLAVYGKYAGLLSGIPCVNSVTTLAFPDRFYLLPPNILWSSIKLALFHPRNAYLGYSRHRKLIREMGITKANMLDAFMNKEELNIVYTSDELQPNRRFFGQEFLFVGPSISGRTASELDIKLKELLEMERPLIYISLGTINNHDFSFYHACLEAFADPNFSVLMSVGSAVDISGLEVPEHVVIRRSLPQLEILKRADLFITHGGMNSVHEGLWFGVPLILIPQQEEQRAVALRVQKLGAGMVLKRKGAGDITQAVHKVLTHPAYRLRSRQLGDGLKEAGGAPRAASQIKAYMMNRCVEERV